MICARFVFALAALGALGGCLFQEPAFTATGARARAPRPGACDVRVTATLPAEGFEEIGVIENTWFREIAQYKQAVSPVVCRAGGELVVTEVNGQGQIVRGVVMAKLAEGQPNRSADAR